MAALSLQRAVGRVVRRYRCARGWSQLQLAVECDQPYAVHVSALERGVSDMRLSTIERVGAALGMGAGRLVSEAEDLQRRAR